jgi:outer membrane protein assembly factor BamA
MDNRDNQLNPQNGYYLETNYSYFSNHSHKNSRFNSVLFDIRYYKTFFKKLVINLNAYSSFNSGEVPFRMMPFIGGPRFLRGYYRGRFRDHNLILVQYEFRYPLIGRLGVAVFSGIGQVAQYLNDFRLDRFHYNYGGGFRFKIDRKENTNVRIDIGFTKDSYGIYLVFAEAF